eukprot:Opistho-2@56326
MATGGVAGVAVASREGYLVKEGGSVKNWKRRWFVLHGNAVLYYADQADAGNGGAPLGTIYLEEIMSAEPTVERPSRAHCFALRGTEYSRRVYYMCADTEDEMREWLKCINAARHGASRRRAAPKREYVSAECFAQAGLRVSGHVHPRVLRSLSHSSGADDKRRDERGWFCARHVPLCAVLAAFGGHGWRADHLYDGVGLVPGNPTPRPATCILFSRGIEGEAGEDDHNARYAHDSDGSDDSDDEVVQAAGTVQAAVEPEPQLLAPMDGFRIEDGTERTALGSAAVLENAELEVCWYRNFFLGRNHSNLIGLMEEEGPFALSIIHEIDRHAHAVGDAAARQPTFQYRVIVWRKTGNERMVIPVKEKQTLTPAEVLEHACPQLSGARGKLRDVETTEDLTKQLLMMEDSQTSKRYKFGILYCKEGQTHESDMFGNETGSPAFEEFLSAMGDRIELLG